MSTQFKVGEVLVGQNFVNRIQRNGQECIVIEGLFVTDHWDDITGEKHGPEPMYRVEWPDGDQVLVRPRNLRRKHPPYGEQSILRMFTQPMPQKELA